MKTKGLKVEMMALDALVPYARNARTHSAAQVAQIAASVREFGWTNPLLVAGDGTVIAGHGRLLAARQLEMQEVPCIVLDHLTESQRRALVIADNRLALSAGWDEDMLTVELRQLSDDGFVMPTLGFDDAELAALCAEPLSEPLDNEPSSSERVLDESTNASLNDAWRAWAADVYADLAASATIQRTGVGLYPSALAIYFLRARSLGERIPHNATLAFHPHQLRVAGADKGGICDLLSAIVAGDVLAERLRFAMAETPKTQRFVGSAATLPMSGHKLPADFPIDLATSLIDEFCPPGGALLDPCHGWGGRVVGFFLSGAGVYRGFDPSPETSDGVRRIIATLADYEPGKSAIVERIQYERAELDPDAFDFALTSPPYFDTERYTGAEQSHATYVDFARWVEGFYQPLLERTARALKRGAVFALQIGNWKYPLDAEALRLAPAVGFEHLETRQTSMSTRADGLYKEREAEATRGEILILLRKK